MLRSVAVKWVAALIFASLLGIALVAVVTNRISLTAFNRLLLDQAQDDFALIATNYYQRNGSWDGFDSWFRSVSTGRPDPDNNVPGSPNRVLVQQPQRRPEFALVDANRVIVKPAVRLQQGDRLLPEQLRGSTPIIVDDQQVGAVLPLQVPLELDPREQAFIDQVNEALVIGVLGALGAALLVGVLLARQLNRPLRELTDAIHAMNTGELRQQVPVRTRDELGELAEAFNDMSAEIDRVNRLRRQMTADIAHDLRTPLTVISGYLEGLRDGTLKPTPSRYEVMFDEVQQLQRLIDDLRTLSLADSGELRLVCQPVNPQELLRSSAAAFQPLAESKGITLRHEAENSVPDVTVDRERMTQVLSNLVSNALRYTPSGGTITLSARGQAGMVHLSVTDTGAGIPAEKLPYIFERFYRGDESRTDSETGLGLAIARSIVAAHGGRIDAESTPGQGTTITIDLPTSGG